MNFHWQQVEFPLRTAELVLELSRTSSQMTFHLQHVEFSGRRVEFLLKCTAYGIWSVVSSQSPISIALVSFQVNVAKET